MSPMMSRASLESGRFWRARFHATYGNEIKVMYTPGNQFLTESKSFVKNRLARMRPKGVAEKAYRSKFKRVASHRPPFPKSVLLKLIPRITTNVKKGKKVVLVL